MTADEEHKIRIELLALITEYQAYLRDPSFREFSQFMQYDHQHRVRLAEQRIDYLERVLYPAPTRADVQRAEIALEDRDGIEHVTAHFSTPKGSFCPHCGKIRQ